MARTEEHNENWGGARPNAGRPRLYNGKRVVRAVTLTEARLDFMLNKYGQRKLSESIRSLIDLDQRAAEHNVDLSALLEREIERVKSAED